MVEDKVPRRAEEESALRALEGIVVELLLSTWLEDEDGGFKDECKTSD